MTRAPLLVCQRGTTSVPKVLRAPAPSGSLLDHSTLLPFRPATVTPSLTTQTSRLIGRLTLTSLRGASTRVAHTGLEPSSFSPETFSRLTLTVPSELTDRGFPSPGVSLSRTEAGAGPDARVLGDAGAPGVEGGAAEGAAGPTGFVGAMPLGIFEGPLWEGVAERASLGWGATGEAGAAGASAETVEGLAGELIPEARSMLIWSPQSKVLAFIRQSRYWPARLSGMGTCQAA